MIDDLEDKRLHEWTDEKRIVDDGDGKGTTDPLETLLCDHARCP